MAVKQIALVDDTGASRAVLEMRDGGPALTLYRVDGEKGLRLALGSNGAPVVELWAPQGESRVELSILQTNNGAAPGLTLFGESAIAVMSLTSTGEAFFVMSSDNGGGSSLSTRNGHPRLILSRQGEGIAIGTKLEDLLGSDVPDGGRLVITPDVIGKPVGDGQFKWRIPYED